MRLLFSLQPITGLFLLLLNRHDKNPFAEFAVEKKQTTGVFANEPKSVNNLSHRCLLLNLLSDKPVKEGLSGMIPGILGHIDEIVDQGGYMLFMGKNMFKGKERAFPLFLRFGNGLKLCLSPALMDIIVHLDPMKHLFLHLGK